jgi:hypothetical protein
MGKERDRLSKVRGFAKRVGEKHRVERVILFGSAARGEEKEDSDFDLILVSEEFKGKSALKRPVPFYLEWDLRRPVDFLCYTPEEFNRLKRGVTIVREAVRNGIEIEV